MQRTLAFVLVTFVAASAAGQELPVTIVLLRTATGPGAYHFAEVIHERGRTVPLDVGYIDFDDPTLYREMWIGGGVKAIATPRGSLTTEVFLAKAFGDRAAGALYLQPFFLGTYMLAPRLLAESVYFAYVPLTSAGHAQHLLERAKVEYDFGRWRLGGGYGAYKSEAGPWEDKPFVTGTVKVPAIGNVEVWLQSLPNDRWTLQVRYAMVLVH